MKVGALVLAGGAGSRALPDDKLLTRGADGRAMLARVLDVLAASRVDDIVVVSGHRAERLAGIVGSARVVHAQDHAEGIAATLRRGVQEAGRKRWEAALVCLADMPLVSTATIDRLAGASCGDGRRPDVVVPMFEGRRGNPLRWDRRQFAALERLSGDEGARTILGRPGLDILTLESGDPGVLEDFDTEERLALYRAAR